MDYVEQLIGELSVPDADARKIAAKTLGEMKDPRAIPALVGALKDETYAVGGAAVDALVKMGAPAVPALSVALENSEDRFRTAKALGGIGFEYVSMEMKILCLLILRKSDEIARIGIPAVPALVEALRDKDPFVRINVAMELREIAKETHETVGVIVPALVDALNDTAVGERIADALGGIGVPAVPALVGALKDEDSRVRFWAVVALENVLGGCDKTESLEMFEKKLKEGAASLRKTSRSKDELHDAMMEVAKLMNMVAARKNELARMDMEKDGLLLSGEKPKPPKGGGMYHSISGNKRTLCSR